MQCAAAAEGGRRVREEEGGGERKGMLGNENKKARKSIRT